MDQQGQPGKATERRKGKCNWLSTISNFITNSLEGFFLWLGRKVGKNPWITILVAFLVSGACMTGMLNFTQENQGDKLWVPQDSLGKKHQAWVAENFPVRARFSVILLTASDVLTPNVLAQLVEIDKKIKLINNGTGNNWSTICFRLGPICLVSSLLELWSFNETVIESLSKNDILQKINMPLLKSPVTGRKFVVSQFLGDIKRDSFNRITAAAAMIATYGLRKQSQITDSGTTEDPIAHTWEKEFGQILDTWKSSLVSLYYFTLYSFRNAAGNAIQSDITLLSAGYMLIIAYVAIMLGRFTRLRMKVWVALLGVLCVVLSIGVCFGLSSAFGESYGPVHSILPFLLLGIGVDDMFVIVQAWSNLSPEVHNTLEVHERIGLALKHAGSSITITSLTDFMAFMIGATTILPALRSFCIFAGIGILVDFMLQVTLFVAFLAIDARREGKMRDACCCCISLSPRRYSESDCGKKDRLKVFFDKIYANVILSLPGKLVIMVITGVLFGVNLYGTLMLRQYFDQVWFLPVESMAYRYTLQKDKFFPVAGESASIYTGRINYFLDQSKLHILHDVAARDQYVVSTSVNSWYHDYLTWAKNNKPAAYFDPQKSKISNETMFYSWLNEYLSGPGKTYASDVKFFNATNGKRISASRINFRHKDMESTQTEVKAMDKLRENIKRVYADELVVFPYGRRYLAWETNKVISEELFRNIALAIAAVFVVTLIVIANLWTSLMVLTCVAFTLVNLGGMMHFWGLTIDTVTTIQLILAVGLAVDYSSHIGYTFMVSTGTTRERAHVTLRDMAPAVINGGFSTFLAFCLLAVSNSYIFKSFFKIFFGVVLFGMFHGLCYLPVLLASIGPAPYESATRAEQKPSCSPSVYPNDSPGDNNRAFEMSGKDGRISSEKETSNGAVQNTGYYIPPPDYEGVEVQDIIKRSSSTNQGHLGSSGDLTA